MIALQQDQRSLNPLYGDASKCVDFRDLVKLPDSFSSDILVQIPAKRQDLNNLFNNGDIDVFGFSSSDFATVLGASGTFFADNKRPGQPNCAMLVCAVCVQIDTDLQGYTLTGQAVPVGAPGPTPAVGAAPGLSSLNAPATFTQGMFSWIAKQAFIKAFRLRLELGCKFVLFDEPLSVIGTAASDGFEGTGTALFPAHQDIRSGNDQALAIGKGFQFVPQTEIASCIPGGGPGTPLPEPVVPVIFGSPDVDGIYGGCFPLPRRLLWLPNMPLSLSYRRDTGSDPFFQQFIDALSDISDVTYSSLFTTVLAEQTMVVTSTGAARITSPTVGGLPIAVPAGAAVPTSLISLSLSASGAIIATTVTGGTFTNAAGASFTLAPGAVIDPSAVSVSTVTTPIGRGDSVPFKNGIWRLRTTFKGFQLAPRACVDWYRTYGYQYGPAWRDMYMEFGGYLSSLAGQGYGMQNGLAGLNEAIKQGHDIRPLPTPSDAGLGLEATSLASSPERMPRTKGASAPRRCALLRFPRHPSLISEGLSPCRCSRIRSPSRATSRP